MGYQKIQVPASGDKITVNTDNTLNVPNNPIIPYIEGDGIGKDIWNVSQSIFDAAVQKIFQEEDRIFLYHIQMLGRFVKHFKKVTKPPQR